MFTLILGTEQHRESYPRSVKPQPLNVTEHQLRFLGRFPVEQLRMLIHTKVYILLSVFISYSVGN
jgi:hypothetical protein